MVTVLHANYQSFQILDPLIHYGMCCSNPKSITIHVQQTYILYRSMFAHEWLFVCNKPISYNGHCLACEQPIIVDPGVCYSSCEQRINMHSHITYYAVIKQLIISEQCKRSIFILKDNLHEYYFIILWTVCKDSTRMHNIDA